MATYGIFNRINGLWLGWQNSKSQDTWESRPRNGLQKVRQWDNESDAEAFFRLHDLGSYWQEARDNGEIGVREFGKMLNIPHPTEYFSSYGDEAISIVTETATHTQILFDPGWKVGAVASISHNGVEVWVDPEYKAQREFYENQVADLNLLRYAQGGN